MEALVMGIINISMRATVMLINGGIALVVGAFNMYQGTKPTRPDDLKDYRQSQIEAMYEEQHNNKLRNIRSQQKASANMARGKRGRR